MSGFRPFHEVPLSAHLGRHELTWREAKADSLALDGRPWFGVERHKLPRSQLHYQVAISGKTKPDSLFTLIRAEDVGPKWRSSDHRSGVLILHGNHVVASYVDSGVFAEPRHDLVVHHLYRGANLAQECLILWWQHFPFHEERHPRLQLNQHGVHAVLAAFPKFLDRQEAAGFAASCAEARARFEEDKADALQRLQASKEGFLRDVAE